jgi:hypothetical protein
VATDIKEARLNAITAAAVAVGSSVAIVLPESKAAPKEGA